MVAGEADHAALNGVDRWVSGVRLEGTVPSWRRDGDAGRIAGPFET